MGVRPGQGPMESMDHQSQRWSHHLAFCTTLRLNHGLHSAPASSFCPDERYPLCASALALSSTRGCFWESSQVVTWHEKTLRVFLHWCGMQSFYHEIRCKMVQLLFEFVCLRSKLVTMLIIRFLLFFVALCSIWPRDHPPRIVIPLRTFDMCSFLRLTG